MKHIKFIIISTILLIFTSTVFAGNFNIANVSNPLQSYLFVNGTTGNVGVGTTSLEATVNVNGTTKLGNGAWPKSSLGKNDQRVGIFSDAEDAYLFMGNMQSDIAANRGSYIYLGARGTNGTLDFTKNYIRGARENAADYSGFLSFATDNGASTAVERMRITSSGSVGIGTTVPDAKLYITDTTGNALRVGYTGNQNIYDAGVHVFRGFSNNEIMRINSSSGNVGIGTTSPTVKLEIVGSGIASTAIYSSSNDSSGGQATQYFGTATDGTSIGQYAAKFIISSENIVNISNVRYHALSIDSTYDGTSSATSPAVSISSVGYLGVGTSSPSANFVVSAKSAQGFEFFPNYTGSSWTSVNKLLSYNRAGSSLTSLVYSASDHQWSVDNSGSVMVLNNGGYLGLSNLAAATGNHICYDTTTISGKNTFSTCSSLRELKINITPLNVGIETLRQLNPVSFVDKASGEYRFGFIAEEVNSINKTLSTFYEGKLRGVDYDGVTSIMVKAIQEQQNIIETQQKEIDAFKQLVCLDHPEAEICKK